MKKYKNGSRKVSKLAPYERNSRTHSKEQIKQIAASIKNEDWRFYPDNDCYVVTASGNVYSVCRRQRSRAGNLIEKYETNLLRGSVDRYGYRTYRIVVDGIKKHIKGHRMIMLSFYGESDKPCVNHKNGIKTDNRVQNLEFVTVAENNAHAVKVGLWNKHMATPRRKVFVADYVLIYLMVKAVGLSRAEVASQFNVCRQTIDTIIGKVHKMMGRYSIA